MQQIMLKQIIRYFDLAYFLRFLAILASLYIIDSIFVAIVNPHNFYSPFIDHYLNYITGLRISILITSNTLAHAFGLNSFVIDNIIKVVNGSSVILNRPCMGLAIMSFWVAFVFAHRDNFGRRLVWTLIGVGIIWGINCVRISLLLLALQNKWKVNKYINHHDLFNYIAYSIIILLICFFYGNNKNKPTQL